MTIYTISTYEEMSKVVKGLAKDLGVKLTKPQMEAMWQLFKHREFVSRDPLFTAVCKRLSVMGFVTITRVTAYGSTVFTLDSETREVLGWYEVVDYLPSPHNATLPIGGETLEVTADYAPEPTAALPEWTTYSTVTTPAGRVIRVADITHPLSADEREDSWFVEGDEAATAADRLLTNQRYDLGGLVGYAMINDPLNVNAMEMWNFDAKGIIRAGIEELCWAAWEANYTRHLGEGWREVKPHVGMMRIDTTGFVMLDVPALTFGEWGWEIGTDAITHLPTGCVVLHLSFNRETEAERGEVAIITLIMLSTVTCAYVYPETGFIRGVELVQKTMRHWQRMNRLPHISYPARLVGALKAKITREAKAPKN